MKKRIFLLLIFVVICVGLIGTFIYNNLYRIDTSKFGYSFLARVADSPDGKYRIYVSIDKTSEDSDVSYIRADLEAVSQQPGTPSKKLKTVFWGKRNSRDIKDNWIDVVWQDNSTVIIDNIKLDVFKNTYDYRRSPTPGQLQKEGQTAAAVQASIPDANQELLDRIGTSSKVEIYHDLFNYFEPDYKPMVITNRKLIGLMAGFFKSGVEPPAKSMSGMAAKDGQKLVFHGGDGVQTVIPFAYDSLYNFGYVENQGDKLYLPYDFFRLVANAETIRPVITGITEDVSKLFKRYGWTPAFLISTGKKTIPADLLANSSDFPDKFYWAYNMELSKSAGMDFTPLMSKEVTYEIYHLVEPLPEFAKPYLNARGIIIRYDGRISGGYIDSGVGADSGCTLGRKSFGQLNGMEISQWLSLGHLDKADPLYRKIAGMSHEELIRTYFKAMADKDQKTLFAAMSTRQGLQSLFTNMERDKLFNMPEPGLNFPGYIGKIEIKEMKRYDLGEGDKNKIGYTVTADITPTANAVISKGIQPRFLILENEGGVWRVSGDGTGP